MLIDQQRRKIGIDLLFAGCLLLLHPFLMFLIGNLNLLANRPLCRCYFFVASLMTILSGPFIYGKLGGQRNLAKVFTIAASVVLLPLLVGIPASLIYDYSVDGQTYHLEMVIQLADGWLPHYEEREALGSLSVYMNHFPAGIAVVRAIDYLLTDKIESSKVYNLTILLSSWLLVLGMLFRYFPGFSKRQSIILSLAAAFNPVSLSQLPTYYIDGIISSLLTILLLVMLLPDKENHFLQKLILLPVICLLAASKFTGLVFAVLIPILILSVRFLMDQRLSMIKSLSYLCFCWVIMAATTSHPYLTNFRDHRHPFYPIYGPDAVNISKIFEESRPINFNSMNRYERLFFSIFSEMGQQCTLATTEPASLKSPFIFDYKKERLVAVNPDIRVAGWGPYFGLALIISCVIFILALMKDVRQAMLMLSISGVILITGLLNAEAWWARFTPHFWLIPIFICALAWRIPSSRCIRIIANLCMAVCIVNILILGTLRCAGTWRVNKRIYRQIEMVRNLSQPVNVLYNIIRSSRIRFQENEISTVEHREETDLGNGRWIIAFPGSDTKVFIPENNLNRKTG